MRDALLGLVVGLLCLVAILQARIGLLGYLWFALMRPDILTYSWSYGRPYSKMLAIATFIGSIRYIPEVWRWFRNPFVILLVLLEIPIGLSVWFAVRRGLSIPYYIPFLQMTAVVLLIPLMIHTLQHFRWLLLTLAVSASAIGVKFGLWGILHGGVRFYTAYGGFISDNNTMALAMVMALPLCWYSRRVVESLLLKNILLGMTLMVIATVVMCHSRSGALTLAVLFLVLAMRSKHKLGAAVALVLLSLPAVLLVRDSFVDRMSSISDTDSDQSIIGRLDMQRAAFQMWKDYPLLGVGFGGDNFAALSSRYLGRPNVHVVHNNHMEMLVDSGIFAFAIFEALLWGAVWWLGRSAAALKKQRPELAVYPLALEGALIAFGVGSVFTSRTYYDFIYILLMSAAAWYEVTRQLTPEAALPGRTPERMKPPVAAIRQPAPSFKA